MQQTKTQLHHNLASSITHHRPSLDPYSSIGKMLPSQLPSAPEYSIGKADRNSQKKIFISEDFSKTDMRGTTYTAAPNSYFPSEAIIQKDGKSIFVQIPNNKEIENKYSKAPNAVIGKQLKESKQNYFSHYSQISDLDINQADKKIKQRCASVRLGSQKRFQSENPNRVTPSPLQYKPSIGINFSNPPKFSFARRTQSQSKLGSKDNVSLKKTTKLNLKVNGPGPGSYFTQRKPSSSVQKVSKMRSQSVNFLRAPENSTMKSVPSHRFQTSLRSNIVNGNKYLQQTYDIKNKTIMAHYDFQRDGGKGHHSGLGWLKDRIVEHSNIPFDKNKMKSYSIGKTQRGEVPRGIFKAHMEFKPLPLRIQHPKF